MKEADKDSYELERDMYYNVLEDLKKRTKACSNY